MPSHSRTTASYGYKHRKIRARLLPAAIGTMCPGDNISGVPYRSPNCDGIMLNPARMHLAHTIARVLGGQDGDTINCAPCNLGAGAALGNMLRPPQPTGPISARKCSACGLAYQPKHHKQRACSPACRSVARQRQAEREAGLRAPRAPVVLAERQCTECDTTFIPNHARRITCSTGCLKARSHRRTVDDPTVRERRRGHQQRWLERTANDPDAQERRRVTQARWKAKANAAKPATRRQCTECGMEISAAGTRRLTCSRACLTTRTRRLQTIKAASNA